jgi:hypothetical protein
MLAARKPKKICGSENREPIYANKLANRWLCSSTVCLFLYYWCILYSILLTLIVLHLSCFETSTDQIKARIALYSALSLFTNILPYVINLKKMSSKYRSAYMSLLPMTIEDSTLARVVVTAEINISQAFDE